jgi:hypothetical protein
MNKLPNGIFIKISYNLNDKDLFTFMETNKEINDIFNFN